MLVRSLVAPPSTQNRASVQFSHNPQDPSVMADSVMLVSGVNNGPSTDRVQLKGTLSPNSNGNFVFERETQPRQWVAANAFSSVASTVSTFEKALGQPIRWAFGGQRLSVTPDAGKDLNAYYSRNDKGLFFFHETDPKTQATVFSGGSGEVAGHEAGHAILDAVRPGYLQAWSPDPAGFHESFGDVLALCMALKNDAVLDKVVQQTRGDLSRPNVAAALGEQLGSAINNTTGKNVTGGNWTRNAINKFTWKDPKSLPESGGPDTLTAQAHNFSRLWTGAFYDVMKGMTDENMRAGMTPKEALRAAADEGLAMYGRVLRSTAPEGDFTYRDMARAFIAAEDRNGGKNSDLLRQVFTDRRILSPGSLDEESLPQGTRTVSTVLEGPQFGRFQGARVENLVSGAVASLDGDGEAEAKLQDDLARLIKAGEIKWTEPNQAVATKDLFDDHGHPYKGVVRWSDGQMSIERVTIAG